ncbi:hypothetical protein M0R45_028279 [Rubus argutus]|uniref:J domain-containing protein n=1 Tax=Rubus argutus TaxID=59490 RepID=A0AAW1W6R0_RUBAR
MECNKEDAIKAVKLAERKMQNNDFTGARKLAQKAQQLFPDLENISQLLAVCEVHCSAENKLGGCEMDWYGILQIERFSYEAIIKKQYRKLGLLLHPDKNKFAGAEAAFKLIGEANAVLADQGKHFIYDMKCRALLRTGAAQSPAHQFNANLFVRKHYDAANNVQSIPQSQYISTNQHQQVQADTVCTCCTFCKAVYKFAKDSRNRLVLCQRCRRLFVASDFGIPGVHPETVRNQFVNNTELPSQVSVELASVHGGTGNLPATRFRDGKAALKPVSKAGNTADVDEASNTEKKDNEHGVEVGKEAGTMSKSGPVKSKDSESQSQAPPNTFWTHCPFCLSSFQCSRNFLDRLLRCHRCRKAFEAHEFGEDVHPESLRNQFPNHKEPPSQGPSNLASQSNGETDKVKFTRFQNGDAASKQVGISADLSGAPNSEKNDGVELGKKSVGTSKSGPVKSKYSETSRNTNKKRKNSIESVEHLKTGNRARADSKHVVIQEKTSSPSELNGGPHLCRSTMKKQNLSYIGNQNDDDDFVNPPKWLGESQLSSATQKKRKTPDPKKEKKRKNGAVDGEPSKIDRSTDSAAAVATQRKEARKENSGLLEESLPRKKSKTGEFELKANMPDNGVSNFKADVSPGPNVDVASPTKIIAVPDPQFHKFALDEDRLQSFFKVNQIWALYDPADDMPRLYAFVKKVLTPGFKLKIHWLEANPDDQSEIDWCEKELPVACGKFRLGSIEEITDHLMFSHQVQVHCAKGSGKSSFLVYPRKGETWALYKNWDIGWSSEPEKHMPYGYEFVEVLSDFVDDIGTEVAHLSKVKGFFSLFERNKQGGDVLRHVPPNELYRFSHRIPSFKMNGNESDDVPEGSFEFDPAAFPTHFDELF